MVAAQLAKLAPCSSSAVNGNDDGKRMLEELMNDICGILWELDENVVGVKLREGGGDGCDNNETCCDGGVSGGDGGKGIERMRGSTSDGERSNSSGSRIAKLQ